MLLADAELAWADAIHHAQEAEHLAGGGEGGEQRTISNRFPHALHIEPFRRHGIYLGGREVRGGDAELHGRGDPREGLGVAPRYPLELLGEGFLARQAHQARAVSGGGPFPRGSQTYCSVGVSLMFVKP